MEAAVASDPQLLIQDTAVRLVRADITELEVDAFVFYATDDLALGSGFGGMIGMRGGAKIQKELDELKPLEPLQVVASGAGKLKAEFILHANGPKFREDAIEEKLATTMVNCLRLAEEKGIKTLAFPAMGAGYYGVPAPVSAKVMTQVFQEFLAQGSGLTEVVVCVLDGPQFKAFDAAFSALA